MDKVTVVFLLLWVVFSWFTYGLAIKEERVCHGVEVVNADNIDSFEGCTIIEGSITILDTSLHGYQEVFPNFTFGRRYLKMHPSKLDAFRTLKEVSGFVSIQASHPDLKNLSFFENLEIIRGRQLTEYFSALYIVETSLVSLNMRSLKKIHSGSVTILENKNLCFANTVKWKELMGSTLHNVILQNNDDEASCRARGFKCHSECSSKGCWGSGPDECLSCKAHKLDDDCVPHCNIEEGIYDAGNKTCEHCHEECLGGCSGPSNDNCTSCRNVKDGPYCVEICPDDKHNNNGECILCNENCVGGCFGPENNIGPNGCKACEKIIINAVDHDIVVECLKAEEPCPEGYYLKYIDPQKEGSSLKSLTGDWVCQKCHDNCQNCTQFGVHYSICNCLHYMFDEQCVDHCPAGHYADETNKMCAQCADECIAPYTTECATIPDQNTEGGLTESSSTPFSSTIHATEPASSEPPKERKANAVMDELLTILKNMTKFDEFDYIGKSVASKLRVMYLRQRIIAEKIISEILFYGQLRSLTQTSTIKLS